MFNKIFSIQKDLKSKKILVHLHLYYQEQLDYFIKKMKNISNCEWDLYITMVEQNEETTKKILKFKPDAKIIKVENRGYDIWPFIQVLRIADISKYDFVLKLHTKNFRKVQINIPNYKYNAFLKGFFWRNVLVDALLGNKKQFKKNLRRLTVDRKIGFIADKSFLLERHCFVKEDAEHLTDLKNRLGIQSDYKYFLAGTMFMIRAEILKILIDSDLSKNDFEDFQNTGSYGQVAHVMERLFTILTDNCGYKVIGVSCSIFNKTYPKFLIYNQLSKNNKCYKVIYIFGLKFSFRNNEKIKVQHGYSDTCINAIKELFSTLITDYKNPKFSIIMPTYNRDFCICNAIESLLNQTCQNFELIIINDGSNDNTEEILKEKYSNEFEMQKFRYFKICKSGVSEARNTGLKMARNAWIAYLDTDNIITPEYLETFTHYIENNRLTECFYAKLIREDNVEIGHRFNYKQLCECNYIDLGVFIHHKSLFEKYGGFDTNLKRLVDWDLIIRYTRNNVPIFIDKVLLKYNNSNTYERITNAENIEEARECINKKIQTEHKSLVQRFFKK